MPKTHLYVLIGVMILLSVAVSILTTADINSGFACGQDSNCAVLADDPSQVYYCHPSQKMCYLREAPKTVAPAPKGAAAPSPEAVSEAKLEEALGEVRGDVSTLQQSIGTANVVLGNIQARLTSIEQGLTTLRSSSGTFSEQLATQGKAVEAGLTGLQKEVNETKTEVSAVSESSRLIKYIFLVLLIAAIALGLIYYVNRKAPSSVPPHVVAYITKHIREGKKFLFIKESLQKAGWTDQEIARAYTETVKQNYQKYAQQRAAIPGAVSGAVSGTGVSAAARPVVAKVAAQRQDKNKVIGIAVVTILLLIGVFFLLSGTVGKAVFYTQEVKEETKEIVQKIKCTPPHILTPTEDACCLDANNNNVCDTAEERQAQVQPAAVPGQCTDNLQCETNEFCIDGRCSSLFQIYKGSPICGKICNYYALVVSTSDGESYNVKPKQGSYSCVGAVEWKIMENADHCQGEKAVVPIAIIMKQPGEIISEQVITLKRRESNEVVHPTLPQCRLTLTMDEIYELCT